MRNGGGGEATEENAIFTSCLCIYKGHRCAEVNNAQVRVQLEGAGGGGNISSTLIFPHFCYHAFVRGNTTGRNKCCERVESRIRVFKRHHHTGFKLLVLPGNESEEEKTEEMQMNC